MKHLTDKIAQILLPQQIRRDIVLSKQIDTDNIKSVCLTLGPYRNLTTLIAAIIFLHPTCQVLNHAGVRIFGTKELDFFLNYDEKTFDNFVKYAIHISGGGTRGKYGGTVTLSHAFDHDNMRKSYFERFGNSLIKNNLECLFWKEPLRISKYIKQNHIDFREIFKKNDKLKFLMPIRNPLDCAESNMRTGHMFIFPDLNKQSSYEEVLESILKEFSWFFDLQRKHSDKFFHFFENKFNENTLLDLSKFLKIKPDREWINSALYNFQIKKRYSHAQNRVESYKSLIEKYFKDYPDTLESLIIS